MNQLGAVIKAIETEENISLVEVIAAGIAFSTIVIDTPATANYLQEGNEIVIIFKETAVSVAKDLSGSLSIRNRFPGIVSAIESGKVLTAVSFSCNGNPLKAIITTRSANELAVKVGDAIVALVKTNDISLMQME